jgi:biotin carboxylase
VGVGCCSKDDSHNTPSEMEPAVNGKSKPYVIIVDPISSGAALAAAFYPRAHVVRVDVCMSEGMKAHVNPAYKHVVYKHTFEFDNDERIFETAVEKCCVEIRKTLGDIQPIACIAGAECGVEVAELLAFKLGCPSNNPKLSGVRRDKYLMGEQLRQTGVRAVGQRLCKEWHQVEAFVKETNYSPFEYIIKPINSAGSDNVRLCKSVVDLKKGFEAIVGKKNVLGIVETSCLVQECLGGDEYVVDTVSRDNMYKVIQIWKYDKRPCNGSAFVYFGMRLISGDSEEGKALCDYIRGVLVALDIVNTAGHSEVKMTPTGPCLIESGARPHGGNGNWVPMAMHCFGYNQVAAIADSFIDRAGFEARPSIPLLKPGGNYACEVMLVSRQAGIVSGVPRWSEVEALPTFHSSNVFLKAGEFQPVTVDLNTCPGSIILMGSCKEDCERDFLKVRELELNGLWTYQTTATAGMDFRDSPRFKATMALTASPRSFQTPNSLKGIPTPNLGASPLMLGKKGGALAGMAPPDIGL